MTKYSLKSRELQSIGVADRKISKDHEFRYESVKYNKTKDYFTVKYKTWTGHRFIIKSINIRITAYGKSSVIK